VVFCKRRRKAIAPWVLAFWLFAIFVSIAQACGLDDEFAYGPQVEKAMVGGHGSDAGAPLPCAKFCSDDLPVLAKIKAVQDPPTGQALIAASLVGDSFQTVVVPIPSLLLSPDLPPGIAVNTRFVRLAL